MHIVEKWVTFRGILCPFLSTIKIYFVRVLDESLLRAELLYMFIGIRTNGWSEDPKRSSEGHGLVLSR